MILDNKRQLTMPKATEKPFKKLQQHGFIGLSCQSLLSAISRVK
jgi:hypothetical protein